MHPHVSFPPVQSGEGGVGVPTGHVQQCAAMHHHVQPRTTMCSHVQPCAAMCSHVQPRTTICSHVQLYMPMCGHGICRPVSACMPEAQAWVQEERDAWGDAEARVHNLLDNLRS